MSHPIRYITLIFGCAIALFVLFVAMSISHLDDAYAQWGAADMVINYMEDHDGEWPQDWSDLRPYFDAGGSRVSGWSYDKFQQHVWIDFSADPIELRRLSQSVTAPPFNVIDSTSIFGPQFDDGPNRMLLRHFNPDARNPPTDAIVAPRPMPSSRGSGGM